MSDTLTVALDGNHVGTLTRTPSGRAQFTATPQALDAYGIGSTVLSCALPLQAAPASADATEAFFGGLLPEGTRRDALARAAGCSAGDVIALLSHCGRDVAGALVLPGPDVTDLGPVMSRDEVAAEVANPTGYIAGGGSAMSGVRPKVAVGHADGTWHAARDGHPSTHILKPSTPEAVRWAHGEAWVMTLARQVGLTDVDVHVETFGEIPTVVVERYDRVVTGTTVLRLHQEDTAQALGVSWVGDGKFETVNPAMSYRAIAGLLDRDRSLFAVGEPDRERLVRYMTFAVLVGNSDAHGKNHALLHDRDGSVRLAPMYDATPLALFGDTQTLALRVNGKVYQPDVTSDDLVAEAQSWGVGEQRARDLVTGTAGRVVDGVRTLPAHESVAAWLLGYVGQLAQHLLDGRRVGLDINVPPAVLKRIDLPD